MTSTPNEPELLACPFCTSLASTQCHGSIFGGDPGYRVECEGDCHAMTCYWHTEAEAIAAWNTRPVEGYMAAFYDLAAMMGIGARPCSPKEVWEQEMRPRLLAALAQPQATEGVDEARGKPIRRWHVGLVADLRAGKLVGIEAAAAIENLEDQLFAAETTLDQGGGR